MRFLLKITTGKGAGSEYTLQAGKNLIGRSRSADVRVFNEDVSGKHFSINVSGDVAMLENISGYGTRVDGVLVQESVELRSGQVIEAGKSLKFIFESADAEINDAAGNDEPEVTAATRFIGEVQTELSTAGEDSSEETSVTRFADEGNSTVAAAADMPDESEATSVTKFAADLEADQAAESIEETSVTKFAADIPAEKNNAEPFTSGSTQVTNFADTVVRGGAENTRPGDSRTVVTSFSDFGSCKTASGTVTADATVAASASEDRDSDLKPHADDRFFQTSAGAEPEGYGMTSGDTYEDQGSFFVEDDLDDSEKTSSNDTQIVQTRMASMDEINFIKNQIKKQQQSRLFFKFLIFCLFFVLLGVIWMLKAPAQEKILSWPQKKSGRDVVFLTGDAAAFERGFKNGGFDIYYPEWSGVKIEKADANMFEIHTFLGKKADVPLLITVQREISDDYVYESRDNALQGMLRRLSERRAEHFNFDNAPATEFLRPRYGEAENGILMDKVAYQRDAAGRSFYGVLRFFRSGRVNYIIRTEVPAGEKLRAQPILMNDTFVSIHPAFVRNHWEGSDEYAKSDIARAIVGVKDELQRNSPMQYPRLEREIKSILAQSLYEKNRAIHDEAKILLRTLRDRQQQWYNGQKIRWLSAVRENNMAEKMKVRNDCEAVFSVVGDKRRYDILRDHWE